MERVKLAEELFRIQKEQPPTYLGLYHSLIISIMIMQLTNDSIQEYNKLLEELKK